MENRVSHEVTDIYKTQRERKERETRGRGRSPVYIT